jgi:DNA-binding NarL/FixJ family response regulator
MALQTLRVLLAENSFTEAGLTLRALCTDHSCALELVFVSNPNKLRETLISSQPHVAVLALSMLQPDPPLAVSSLHQAAPHIPLILLARSADKGCALKCLSSGAENYMLEGYLDVQTLDHLLHTALHPNDSSDSPVVLKSQVSVATDLPNRSGLLRCVRPWK